MTKERKRWVVLIALSVVIAGAFMGLAYMQHRQLEERRADAAKLTRQIEADRELLKRTPDLVKEVIVQRETDATIKEILSDDEDINNFVRTLRRFEEESGISITQIRQQRSTKSKSKEDFDRVAYTLSFQADVFQLLTFMDRVESHARLMSVTSFKLTSSRRSKNDEGIPRHRVQLDLETYVYQPKGGAREVKIDHYERKRDLLISEISKRTSELRIPRYEYKGAQGRRDPWVDPRVPVNVDGQIMLTIEEQIAIVDALVQKAAEARALWRVVEGAENLIEEMKARADVEEKLAVLEEEVRRIETDNQLTFVPAERRFENDVVAVMSELRTRMTGTEQTGGPSLTALTEAAEAMERHLESGEYELAIDTFRAIEPRLGMAERDERKLPLVQALQELDRLAKTVIEFEAIRLDINGIAIYEDRRPVALINGTAVAEGELLGEELLVRNISPDQIEFSFRGMVLAVPVEASHDGSIPQNGRRR